MTIVVTIVGEKMAVIVEVAMFKEIFRKFSKDFKMVVSSTVVNARAWLYLVNLLQLIGEMLCMYACNVAITLILCL